MLSLVCVSWKLSGDKGKSDGTCARKRKKSVWRLVCTFVKNDRKIKKNCQIGRVGSGFKKIIKGN